jgi:cytochrome c-type biogenesis protein
LKIKTAKLGFLSSALFGVIFSIGWTPCVGVFLGSALMLAASSGESLKGIFMLLSFSLGLGIPFIASAILIDRLKSTFDFIKKNYRIINLISGGLLVVVGLMMATGLMGYFLSLLTF